MSEQARRGRAVRWAVPVAAIALVTGAIGAGPVIAAVQGDPTLPERTAEQLLASAAQASQAGLKPMSGTVMQTASLGLPGLPAVSGMGGSSPAALLAGSHELKVWYGGEDKVRFALPGRMSETDLIVNGDQVWMWQSDTNKATRIKKGDADGTGGEKGLGHGGPDDAHRALPTATTPQQLARQLLGRIGADTAVSVTNTEKVADRAAYQLVLAPKDTSSLVREVKLALDGETFVPLRIQVYARNAAEPAFEVGFTSVTFSPPAAENFTFTPPAGAKVEEASIGELAGEHGAQPGERLKEGEEIKGKARTVGEGWTTVAVIPASEMEKLTSAPRGEAPEGQQDAGAITDALLKSAKPISGTWGSGKVIQTKLVSALLTDDGRLLVGAVTPEKLSEAAGRK
ncbi:outer membrane lipoprotein carrier protein LolA [Streptosporangium oxazolinicum]|uniref:Outer membrane lipoprotein carrier protein LolA n=1 Tax=Streptosporangium oxazolinicum TaxID=909287 RepID=A0ABP8AX17_9ACTN